jgi:Rrf2 family protein
MELNMEISRRTDYAIRLIAALLANEGEPMSVREAADMQGVPYSFARSIQHDLVKSGMVVSIRGARGGMVLAGDPNALTLLELVETVQGPINVAVCTSEPDWCPRERGCEFHKVWEGAAKIFKDYLSSVSIKDLMAGKPACLKHH